MCVALAATAWLAAGSVYAVQPASTPRPIATATPTLDATVEPTASPSPTPEASDTPTPDPTDGATPARTTPLFVIDLYKDNTFVSQTTKEACTAGAVQNMLNIIGPKVDKSATRQTQISDLLVANTTKEDSHDGGYGPEGWAITLTQLGGGNYKLLVDPSLSQAMHDAAVALRRTGRPVGLLSWKGAHSWVMTGFRTDRDPRKYSTFTLYGAYIVDPFYPRHSSIWGQTMGPDTYRDWTDLNHDFLGWKRPDSRYPGRDGKWLLVVPY